MIKDGIYPDKNIGLTGSERQSPWARLTPARQAVKLARMLTKQSAFDLDHFRSFSIRLVESSSDMKIVSELRESKYGPGSGILEDELNGDGVELYLALDPEGVPTGTIRFSYDLSESGSLITQTVTEIPEVWRFRADGTAARLGEALRLCNAGRSEKVQLATKLILWRQVFWRCQDLGVDWLVVLARFPLNTDYRMMGYVSPEQQPTWVTPGNSSKPHEMLALDLNDRSIPWRNPGHWIHTVLAERN